MEKRINGTPALTSQPDNRFNPTEACSIRAPMIQPKHMISMARIFPKDLQLQIPHNSPHDGL
jgi:hypothetical protein